MNLQSEVILKVMKKNSMRFLTLSLLFSSMSAFAGEVGPAVTVTELRPYIQSPLAYMVVSGSSVNLCGTTAFSIETSAFNGKEAYAAALTALVTGKKIRLEVSNTTGCTGWGTRIQSIFLQQ